MAPLRGWAYSLFLRNPDRIQIPSGLCKKEKAALCSAAKSRLKQPTDQSNLYTECETCLANRSWYWASKMAPSEAMTKRVCSNILSVSINFSGYQPLCQLLNQKQKTFNSALFQGFCGYTNPGMGLLEVRSCRNRT